ncbi:MAG: pantetheine-phosphate adenylyltransferase [Verrucomicrobia bacterium]|nr:pantetheine-phosphate adenylyltransferase [Verrucomicrobiota bacterium]
MKKRAIYPGSFDPITNGHLDVIERAARLFDEVIVAIAVNPDKHPLFTARERQALVRRAVAHIPHARVDSFDGLLVDYARRQKAVAIVRGLRAVSDFEFEFQMALMNRRLEPRVETVFLMPRDCYAYLSSRIIKGIVTLGGSANGFVPPFVEAALRKRLRKG